MLACQSRSGQPALARRHLRVSMCAGFLGVLETGLQAAFCESGVTDIVGVRVVRACCPREVANT